MGAIKNLQILLEELETLEEKVLEAAGWVRDPEQLARAKQIAPHKIPMWWLNGKARMRQDDAVATVRALK
jgi:hypothetical protein